MRRSKVVLPQPEGPTTELALGDAEIDAAQDRPPGEVEIDAAKADQRLARSLRRRRVHRDDGRAHCTRSFATSGFSCSIFWRVSASTQICSCASLTSACSTGR